MIIALTGEIGVGKSTIAKSFLNKGYNKLSFADIMKNTCANVFPWVPRNAWWDPVLKETLFDTIWHQNLSEPGSIPSRPVILSRYVIEQFNKTFNLDCSKVCDQKGYVMRQFGSPREALQFIGTEVLRATDPDCHVKATMAAVIASESINWVNDDLRFDNEAQAIKDMGGYIVKVEREGAETKQGIAGHASEAGINPMFIDMIFINGVWSEERTIADAADTIKLLVPGFAEAKRRFLDEAVTPLVDKTVDQYLKDHDGA